MLGKEAGDEELMNASYYRVFLSNTFLCVIFSPSALILYLTCYVRDIVANRKTTDESV